MLYLISVFICGITGGVIAKLDGWQLWVGVLVGSVFNVLGVAFLAGVWLAEWFSAQMDRLGAKS